MDFKSPNSNRRQAGAAPGVPDRHATCDNEEIVSDIGRDADADADADAAKNLSLELARGRMRSRRAERGSGSVASLHARLDAAKLRVQKDLEASARGIPLPRRTRPDRTTRPDRIPPPQQRRHTPVERRSPAARPAPTWPAPSESRAAYVGAPAPVETDTPPAPARYKALLLEQDAQTRQRSELLDRLERELSGTAHGDGGIAKGDREARASALQAELADQAARRQQLLAALQDMPRADWSPTPGEDNSSNLTAQDGSVYTPPTSTPFAPAVETTGPTIDVDAVSPRRLSTASVPGSDGSDGSDGDSQSQSDSDHHSNSNSDSDPRVAPEGMNAAVQDYTRTAEKLKTLWTELSLAVGSQRDYSSLLTMVRDAMTDFW
eukprot:COSAG02_NODE_5187_length_4558_cov_2.566495_3_plen_378_part_00